MKRIGLMQRLRLPTLVSLAIAGLMITGFESRANSIPFSHLFFFGDSLSDTGNLHTQSGGLLPPYGGTRYSNGPLWVEYLAKSLRMDYEQADNFAFAGATTGSFNSNNGTPAGTQYPGLLEQIALFQNLPPVSEPERALYVVGAGANDFFMAQVLGTKPAELIASGVGNTVTAVQQLSQSGAKYIMVMNLPDLGVTPMALSMPAGTAAGLTQLATLYNQVLDQALANLAEAGIPTIRLDAFATLDEMANNPDAYGFTDVTHPASFVPGSNPNQFLFWDPVHPTTVAHKVLADEALDQLIRTFSPSEGQGTPDAMANGLRGLVNARSRK